MAHKTYDNVLETGVFPLNKPYKHDEKEYTELDFPLRSLNGQHIRQAEKNYKLVEGDLESVPELSKSFLAYVAAALMKVNPDFVFDLPATDFARMTMFVQAFLLNGDS